MTLCVTGPERLRLQWEADALLEFLVLREDADNLRRESEMNEKKIIIWTQEDCPLCQRVKAYYGEGNYEERAAQDLLGGNVPDIDAMAQLAMQDMQLPLVQVAGEWQDVSAILAAAARAA